MCQQLAIPHKFLHHQACCGTGQSPQVGSTLAGSMRDAAAHYEIWKYYQSTSKVHVQVSQNLAVQLPCRRSGPYHPCIHENICPWAIRVKARRQDDRSSHVNFLFLNACAAARELRKLLHCIFRECMRLHLMKHLPIHQPLLYISGSLCD